MLLDLAGSLPVFALLSAKAFFCDFLFLFKRCVA